MFVSCIISEQGFWFAVVALRVYTFRASIVCLPMDSAIVLKLSILGLNEAEAFGDVELMAEFSLLSVAEYLQQGKIHVRLLETLEVRLHEIAYELHPGISSSRTKEQTKFGV